MATPILFHWGPCTGCQKVEKHAAELGIELDKRDVEFEQPYNQLTYLGGDANKIPYIYADDTLIQGVEQCNAYLDSIAK